MEKPNSKKMMADGDKKALLQKAHSAIILSLEDKVLRQVSKETIAAWVWSKLEGLYMTKSLVNRLYLKQSEILIQRSDVVLDVTTSGFRTCSLYLTI